MTTEDRFVYCRDNITDNDIIAWDDWCESMEIDVPIDATKDEWKLHVQARNSAKKAINRMAQRRKSNWRLLIHETNKTITKSVDGMLVSTDIPQRAKRIMQHILAAKDEAEAFREIEKLSDDERMFCRDIGAMLQGTCMYIYGIIERMKNLDSRDKQTMLSIFDIRADKENAS